MVTQDIISAEYTMSQRKKNKKYKQSLINQYKGNEMVSQ
jgi:hypothetical protein